MNLEELGLSPKILIAGFAGGVVHALFFGNRDPWTVVASIVGGLFTANYVGPAIASAVNIPDALAGFGTGLTAMIVCQGIVGLVRSRISQHQATASPLPVLKPKDIDP